jgi:hypothetical protein
MRRALAATLAGAMALTVAACSSTGSTDSSLSAKRAASKSSTSSTTLPFESSSTHTPGTLAGFVGAKNDAHDVECGQHGASWSATGKLTNPTKQPVKYRVYVSFLSGDTTVGLAESDSRTVGPKATEDFSAGVKVDGRNLHCVLRVERASA